MSQKQEAEWLHMVVWLRGRKLVGSIWTIYTGGWWLSTLRFTATYRKLGIVVEPITTAPTTTSKPTAVPTSSITLINTMASVTPASSIPSAMPVSRKARVISAQRPLTTWNTHITLLEAGLIDIFKLFSNYFQVTSGK
jgi:hypothetical protein